MPYADVGPDIDLTPRLIRGRRWRAPFFAPKHRPPQKSPDVQYYNADQVEHLIRSRAARVRLCVDDLNISGKPWRHLGDYERDMVQKFGHSYLQVLDDAGQVILELHGFPSDKRRPHDSGKLLHDIKAWAMHPASMRERQQYFQHYGTHVIGPADGHEIGEIPAEKREMLEKLYGRPVDIAFLVANAMRGINHKPVGYVVPHKPVHDEMSHQLARLEKQLPGVRGWRRWKKKGRIFLVRKGMAMNRTGLRYFSPRRFSADGDAVGGNSNNVTEEFMRAFQIHKIASPHLEEFRERENFTIPKASIPLITTILARRASVSFFSTLQGAADRPLQTALTASAAFVLYGNNPNAPQMVQQMHAQLTTIGNPQNLPVYAQYVAGEVGRHTVSIKALPAMLLALWHMRKTGQLPDMAATGDSLQTFDI